MVESLSDGNFPDKTAEEGYKFLHEVAEKSQECEARESIRSMTSTSTNYRVENEFNSEAKFDVLTRRLESLEKNAKIKHVESIAHTSFITNDFSDRKIPSLEERMSLFMQATQSSIANLEEQLKNITRRLDERDKGQFPSQIQLNHNSSFEVSTSGAKRTHRVQAASTLRSGRVIDNHVSDPEEKEQDRNPPTITQVKVNIPLLDAIKQIPFYAKFLRDMCTMKRKLNVHKKAFLTEQVSSIITQKTPPKFMDPGCPTIACTIGEHRVEHALLDLGASVNLLPYSVYVQLELGDLKSTSVTLQLDDRSIKIPRGVVEDVLIQVESFVYPVDFIVLDTQPVSNPSGQIPIILGRPFLATSNAVINCRNGIMKLTFGNMKMEINVFSLSNSSHISETCEHSQIITNRRYNS
ncbi:uncharacterized protein LOC113359567 [Papaver somniferum]|uniref:uncharacterized protein LOC113359567 n=1 Tax=Papaver somniferum TaxID=3469 RepID=UPI000E6F73A8|nr:uncharacterized protein LOC113359567 [Papaver somniferum]